MNLHTALTSQHTNLLADMRLGRIRHNMARIEDGAQDFTLVNQNGELVNMFDQLEDGPIVLAFVNGNETIDDQNILCELGKLRKSMAAHNASLMVIAPHSRALDAHRHQCNKLEAEILHDVGNHVAFRYGLVQGPTGSTQEFYEDFTGDGRWADQSENLLPVAAIYVIRPNRQIAFSYAKTGDSFLVNSQELLATLS